jgi:hypothetical protein
MKKIIVLLVVFLSCSSISYASLEIKEIMYDPEGSDINREWVKLYNNGDENIKVIGGQTKGAWRISGGELKESLHYINEDLNIIPGGYAIITKNKEIFREEYPSFSGPITTSSISFNNTKGIVKIWDGEEIRNVLTSLEYDANDIAYKEEEIANEDPSNTLTSVYSYTSSSQKEDIKILKITTKIISPKIAVAGIPISLSSITTTNRGATYNFGKFIWNFGDGIGKEVKESTPFYYIYDYPGDYILNLSYFDNSFTKIPDATNKIILKVIPSDIYISSVGDYIDPYVEIENKSKYEVDLSNWSIKGGEKIFIFPENTTLMQGKKIKLSGRINGFNTDDLKYLNILNPSKDIVSTYPEKRNNTIKRNLPSEDTTYSKENNSDTKEYPQIINLNDLAASASDSKVNISKTTYSIIGLIFIIGLGITSFLFLKKKKGIKDYVDGEVTADNIKILE